MKIRPALIHDANEIQRIYKPYVDGSAVSFEAAVPSLGEIQSRIRDYSRWGWFVAEAGPVGLAGYAYACGHRTREAYQWACEVSVYVDSEFHRQGVARALYLRLFEELKSRGYVNAYAGITLPNEKSVRFHEAMGFRLIGVYPKIGYKAGAWRDVGWWGLVLNEYKDAPERPNL